MPSVGLTTATVTIDDCLAAISKAERQTSRIKGDLAATRSFYHAAYNHGDALAMSSAEQSMRVLRDHLVYARLVCGVLYAVNAKVQESSNSFGECVPEVS